VLLRRLVGDGKLAGVSHVLVDEIHERGILRGGPRILPLSLGPFSFMHRIPM
jgi:hypothetical protein